MGLFTSYSESAKVQFTSPVCSKATIFNFMVVITILTAPYILSYRSSGFWNRLEYVREQPNIRFKYEALVIMELQQENGSYSNLVWTTIPGLSSLQKTKISPLKVSREGDDNMDGVNEYLDIQLQFTLPKNVSIKGVHYMLLFDYRLTKHATFQMEAMVYGNFDVKSGVNRLDVIGDITLVQREPLLYHRVRDTRFNSAVIPRNSPRLQDYQVRNILDIYTRRNVSAILGNKYSFWTTDTEIPSGDLLLSAKLHYTEQSYEVWAGFWTVLKWAWVQYFCVFVLVAVVVKKFQGTVYKARMFETRIKVPWPKPTYN